MFCENEFDVIQSLKERLSNAPAFVALEARVRVIESKLGIDPTVEQELPTPEWLK
jgi:hypothetical protein